MGDGVGTACVLMITGTVAVFLLGNPRLWLFPAGAVVMGLAFALWASYRDHGSAPLSLNGEQTGESGATRPGVFGAVMLCVALSMTVLGLHPAPATGVPGKYWSAFLNYQVLRREWFDMGVSFHWEEPLFWWFIGFAIASGLTFALVLRLMRRKNTTISLMLANAVSVGTEPPDGR